MILRVPSTPLDDIEFLARSDHRVTVLEALADEPRSRADLQATTGASSSTVGRTLRAFEGRNWIRRNGDRYEATQLGAFVAAAMRDLIDRLETERKLRDVWDHLPGEDSGLTLEMITDAVVTAADVDAPYRPVYRFASLLRETDRFRFVGYDVALLEPCKDEFRERVLGGMRAEIVDSPGAAEYVLSSYREHCERALESGNLTVHLHEELPPYGVALFDDRIAIICYDRDSGMVRTVIDTAALEAREWAETTFESYRCDARPLVPGPTER